MTLDVLSQTDRCDPSGGTLKWLLHGYILASLIQRIQLIASGLRVLLQLADVVCKWVWVF